MNLKGKIVIITLVAIVALVGVGFATWTFTTPVDGDAGISAGAHAAIEASNVEVKTADGSSTISTLYIICDQTSGNGIYWSKANGSTALTNQITQIKLVGSVKEEDFDVVDFTTYTGTFTCTFAGYTGTYFDIPAISFTQDVTSNGRDDAVTYTYTLPDLNYKVTPASVAQVEAMQTEINGLSLTIDCSFNVKSVTAA